MKHHYVIFDKFPKLVENSIFFLESAVIIIFDFFTNILGYLIEHRHFRINKCLDLGHWGTGRPLITYSIIKRPHFCYLRTKQLKLTTSKCPGSEGRTLTYHHGLLNISYASVCRLFWNSGSNYWFDD